MPPPPHGLLQQHNSQHNQRQTQQQIQQQQIQHLAQQFRNSITTGNATPTSVVGTQHSPMGNTRRSPFDSPNDSMSLFSNNGFSRNPKPHVQLHTGWFNLFFQQNVCDMITGHAALIVILKLA